MQPNDPNQFTDPNQTPIPPPPQPLQPQQPIASPNPDPLDQTEQYPANQPAPIMPDMNTQNVTPTPVEVPVQPSVPPPQPAQTPTPLPVAQTPMQDATANTFDTPPSPVPMPASPPQPLQPQDPMPQAPKKSLPVKKLLLVLGALLVVGLIAVLAIFIVGKLGSDVPKYSETKSIELAGFSTDENSGMSFEIPKEMEETIKTDLSATYVHKDNSKESNTQAALGGINASINTVSYTADVTDAQKKEVADKFKSDSFDSDASEFFDSEMKNIKIGNKTVSDDNSLMRAEVSLDMRSIKDNETVPAKGVIILSIVGKRAYSFLYFFTNEVFDNNTDLIRKMEESVKFGV
ncbi:MAG TPA: hypothetical protein PKB09_04315 [Candidatus Saccharibacteria bacterium]|nr:hypothetical protein [Candidatus Saccharibacteria bacterium]